MKKLNLIFTAVSLCTTLIVPHAGHSVVQIIDTTQTARQKIQAIQTDDDIPVGTIMPWPSAEPIPYPAWLPCDGSAIPDYGPYKDRYAFLRRIIGDATPNYNNGWRDHKSGAFLRGSNTPRYGMRFEDSTKTHIHTQPEHSHRTQRIWVENDKFVGQSVGQKYQNWKRGQNVLSAFPPGGPVYEDLPDWGFDIAQKDKESPFSWGMNTTWVKGGRESWDRYNFSALRNAEKQATQIFLDEYLPDTPIVGRISGTGIFNPRSETYCVQYSPVVCDEEGKNCTGGNCIRTNTETHTPIIEYSGTAQFKTYKQLFNEQGESAVAFFLAGSSKKNGPTTWSSGDPEGYRVGSLQAPHPLIKNGDFGVGTGWVIDTGDGSQMEDSVAFGEVIDKTVVGNEGRTPGQNDGYGLQENGDDWSFIGQDNRGMRDQNESAPAHYNVVYIIKAMP